MRKNNSLLILQFRLAVERGGGGVHLEYEKTKNAYTGLHTLKMSTVSSLISCTISASVQKGPEGGLQKYGCFVLKKMRNQNFAVLQLKIQN